MDAKDQEREDLDGRLNEGQDLIARVRRWRREASAYHQAFVQHAIRARDFYDGDQWDPQDKQQLADEGRPALTINLVRPQIDLASGIQRQEKIDLKFIGRTKDDAPVAEAMTKVVKYVCDRNDFEMRQGDVFLDGVITGRGWFVVEMHYRDDFLNGEIAIRQEPPEDVIIPRGVERDLSDCPWLLRIKRIPLAAARRLWPKHKDDFKILSEIAEAQRDNEPGGDYGKGSDAVPAGASDVSPYGHDAVEVIEAFWEDYEPVLLLIDEIRGTVEVVKDERRAREAARMIETIRLVERTRRVIRCARITGSTVLEGPITMPDGRYPLVPFFCFRGRKGDYGIVKNAIDPQQEVNKRRSQALHIINTSANSGWITDDPELLEQLTEFGSRPGMGALKKAGTTYERILPTPMPAAVMQMEQQSRDDIKAITGINSDLLGIREATQSGVAIDLRMRQGLTVIAAIFDNYRLALREVARRVAARIVAYMPEDEIARILGEEATPELVRQVKSFDALRYDLVAAQSPSTPSIRMSNFLMLMEMKKTGVPIPDEAIVEASDLPGKEKILEKLAQPAPKMPLPPGLGGPPPSPGAALAPGGGPTPPGLPPGFPPPAAGGMGNA